MNLLIVTQKVDKNDPVLGFFHRWIEEFAKRCQKVTVICLEKGEHSLPESIRVLSLGKEKLKIENSKLKIKFRIILNFYSYIWQERKNYDAVFVHMNQEYVLLAGDLWRMMGKKVYLWRNHAKGSILTDMAVWMAHKVFCTSPSSYTARFKKTVLMPVGIDTDFFKPDPSVSKIPNSYLFLGRIAPVKKVLEFVEWFNKLEGEPQATIAGEALERDKEYEDLVKSRASERIKFVGAVSQEEARRLYQTHEFYVNFTPSGSMDKTILEAAACGTKIIVKNEDLKLLENKAGDELRNFAVENHSLDKLMDLLEEYVV